jgi:hypothetical protein
MSASAGAGAREGGCAATTCVLAFGTRGDVQPLAVLASALADAHGSAVTFITHAAHAPLLDAPLRAAGVTLVCLRCVHMCRVCCPRCADL